MNNLFSNETEAKCDTRGIWKHMRGGKGASTSSTSVETNFSGSMLKISVGSQEVWLTRDQALAVCDALPGEINHMPVKI